MLKPMPPASWNSTYGILQERGRRFNGTHTMQKLLLVIAVFLGWTSTARPETPPALTSLPAIQALSGSEARKALPVAVEGTVTYYDNLSSLFIQEGDSAIYVQAAANANLVPGDRVQVRGKTHMDFRPDVYADETKLLRHGSLPNAVPTDFPKLIRAEFDCRRVTVHATVRSADIVTDSLFPSIYLELLMDGGYIEASVIGHDPSVLKELLDADVEITGVVTGKFDSKKQLAGIVLAVPSMAGVKILKRASVNPASLPFTPMDEILKGYDVRDLTQRVRVKGTITYNQPGSAVVLQNGAKSLWIKTLSEVPFHVGHLAEATGFPDARNGDLTLTRGDISEETTYAPIPPAQMTWKQLAPGTSAFDLVSVEGVVLTSIRGHSQDEFVLVADGHRFSAIYRHPDTGSGVPLPPMKIVPVGARLRVTGICVPSYGSDPLQGPVAFDILLRSFNDIVIVGTPSWLTIRNLLLLVALLLAVVVVVGARGWIIEHKVRRQTVALAYIEQRRSRILEDINGSRPLAEVLEEITELASFKLSGAPCWCQIAEGAKFGNRPPVLTGLRVIQTEIPAHSGAALGTVFAALNALVKPHAVEGEAMTMAVGLATLAIETRRLYSDLRRRSEFDQLTDIHNRSFLDARLNKLIEESRKQGAIFGLIYIDLDDFKLVNDRCGHHVGDHYLQQSAQRMNRQLRGHDMLARLGGDEFAVLVQRVRTRADIEEIALRLEHCFDDPLSIDGFLLNGSASVGFAIYPEDGETGDSLLKAADAAMYRVKNAKPAAPPAHPIETHP
jgi:diguanylate cyclase (GGDEF)-like protein